MEIWLDTADEKTVDSANRFGIFFGITTNPSILSQLKEPMPHIVTRLLEIQEGPVAVQTTASSAAEIIAQAEELQARSERIIIKVPVSQEGFIAIRHLSLKDIPTMATAVFHPKQFLFAALAGATYIAPYLGRMADAGISPFDVLKAAAGMYRQYEFKTKILAAALKSVDHIQKCADLGIAGVTIKDELYHQFISEHPLTVQAINNFAKDSEQGTNFF